MKNMAKMFNNLEITFCDIMHILHHKSTNFCISVVFHMLSTLISIKSEMYLKLKVKMKNILIFGFQWG